MTFPETSRAGGLFFCFTPVSLAERDEKLDIHCCWGVPLWAPAALRASSFATEVIDYETGEGFAKDWATGAGFTKQDPSLVRRRA